MRARERYAERGPAGFGEIEMLALVLGTGSAGRSSREVAATVLARVGGLAALADASVVELTALPGLGLARAVRVHAALQLGRRTLAESPPTASVRTPDAAAALLAPALRGLVDEELHALYLDRRRRPIACRQLTKGSDAFTVVDPRQVFREAVRLAASGVILGHNHPSGDPTPSRPDRDVTDRVAAAGRVLGLPLRDHLGVGASRVVSRAEAGRRPAWHGSPPCWTADTS